MIQHEITFCQMRDDELAQIIEIERSADQAPIENSPLILIVKRNAEVLGYLGFSYDAYPKIATIHAMGVKEVWRRASVGRSLIEDLAGSSNPNRNSPNRIQFTVDEDHLEMLNFLRAMKFVAIRIKRRRFITRDGIQMQRIARQPAPVTMASRI